ncbi:serine hydrolase domain-containing protein [Terrabacter sp. 2RAF25]|uniref:serine hydrolase domain-containing protein n=1 Tax=Terrabacter sp. 2RAF25 TaxID=3232998 RepID=UPI003F9DBC62
MEDLAASVGRVADEQGFSGVVRVDRDGVTEHASAHGLAERAFGVPITLDTQFGVASIAKSLTAMTVVSLVADVLVGLDARVRDILGDELPEIADDVTVEHLLSHRSGIGDYLDEDLDLDPSDHVMTRPVHEFVTTDDYVPSLRGHATKFAAGERFSYCNSGFVVLALVVERITGTAFHDVVAERVCAPAGLRHTVYLRSDELPASVARGYLDDDGLRTNVLHLPVRGSGDGGVHTTVGDLHALWNAFVGGRVVPERWVAEMVRPRSVSDDGRRYGLGLWLAPTGDGLVMNGYDAGVSARSAHEPGRSLTWTVVSNTSNGIRPLVRHLAERLDA